ncbi:hypothetical protein [Streptomyces sp. SID4985]|uniref:DUF7003 family protein n=1 Tax=unclassified Streptomyces TaxID=2593676 RepID=UPI0019285C56|nr:hypothetical protein [Streptomyces sp. SID4985]
MITTAAILAQFDRCADEAVFPDPDNGYYQPVDARMSLFHSPGYWAMVVELLGYVPRARRLTDVLHVFGNCLTSGEPGFDNGDFLDRDLPLAEPTADTPLIDVLRALVPTARPLFLADDRELRARLPADLPLVLQLDAWTHPTDLGDTLPSDHETFRQLAEVLATGDPRHYRPTTPPNTHWSAWPDAGTL